MEEKKLYKYAFYNIDGKDFFQYLPTNNIEDVIYVKGMKSIKEKLCFKDNNYFIEVNTKDKAIGVGEPLLSKDIVRRYYELDPILQHYDKNTIDSLDINSNANWILSGDGEITLGKYHRYVNVNKGEIPVIEQPQNVIKVEPFWYLELHHKDGSVTYEKTLYNDKKYRGQQCEYYNFVKVVEYEIDEKNKQVIIEKDEKIFPYTPIEQTKLDMLIDDAKNLIFNKPEFSGFATSPLYTFNTEDSACVFHDNQDKIKGNVVTTVTGSADSILDLFLYGAQKIIAFDINPLTKFYGQLKFVAAKYLSFDEFRTFLNNFNEETYKKIEHFLSNDARKFWNEIFCYSRAIDKKIKDPENGGLFYPTISFFTSNCTTYNKKGYYNQENYSKLQNILKNKTLEDVTFTSCDLLDLPNKINLKNSSFAYLSNIMDFIVGVDSYEIDSNKLKIFKDFILNKLLPSLKENSDIVLSYISSDWHTGIDDSEYLEVYSLDEGFKIIPLSNKKDRILSFKSSLLEKNNFINLKYQNINNINKEVLYDKEISNKQR